jgi:hypothetical protein
MEKKLKLRGSEKEQLQPLLDFINTDIDSLDEPEFLTLVWNYLKFLEQSDRFLNETQSKFQKFIEGLPLRPGSNTLLERKKILNGLQKNLRSKIEKVINSTVVGKSGLDKKLIALKGTRNVTIDIDSDRFVDKFMPQISQSSDKIDLKNEKLTAETVFADMLRDYELKPKRFSFCAKEGCDNLLYQFDLRQKYCSDRCSGAGRQEKFQTKLKKDKKKRLPKKRQKTD